MLGRRAAFRDGILWVTGLGLLILVVIRLFTHNLRDGDPKSGSTAIQGETSGTKQPQFDPATAWADFTRLWFLKLLTLAWFLLVLGACAYAVAATWNDWWPYSQLDIPNLDSKKTAIYAFVGGAIGAALYAFHGFCVAAGPQRADVAKYHYDPSWSWWYLAWPPIGAFVGAVTYAALKTGVATLGTTSQDTTTKTAYFVIAVLAGLGSRHALDWLGAKARGMFATTTDSGNSNGQTTAQETGKDQTLPGKPTASG